MQKWRVRRNCIRTMRWLDATRAFQEAAPALTRDLTFRKAERLFCILFAAAFFGFGIAAILRPSFVTRNDNSGPYSSTDSMLREALDVPRASEPISRAIASVPTSRTIAFIANRSDNESNLAALTISYLAWPHTVFITYVAPDEVKATVDALKKWQFGALFFFALKPPPDLPDARSAGERLVMIPQAQNLR